METFYVKRINELKKLKSEVEKRLKVKLKFAQGRVTISADELRINSGAVHLHEEYLRNAYVALHLTNIC